VILINESLSEADLEDIERLVLDGTVDIAHQRNEELQVVDRADESGRE
jgi:hypothetical protein